MTWTTQPRSKLADLAAVVVGDGPNLLFIHGVGLRAEAWNAQIARFAPQHRVIAVDMPGHGGSPDLQTGPSLSAYTDAIAAVLAEPAVVIGHSMGAMIALDLAIRYPNRVSAVAALNAIYNRSTAAAAAIKVRAQSLNGASVADAAPTLRRWFGDAPSPERDACQTWLTSVSPDGYQMAYRVFAHEDGPSPQALATISCPALFMTGSAEPNSTPDMSRQMAALVPQGRAHVVQNAAHMMPMTHADEVNTHLMQFAEQAVA